MTSLGYLILCLVDYWDLFTKFQFIACLSLPFINSSINQELIIKPYLHSPVLKWCAAKMCILINTIIFHTL